MKEVFISYSTIDTVNAETVRNILEKNGLSCWMAPRDIPGGSNYTKEIPIAIRNCKVFVLILSKNAQSSQWVLKELDSAVNCGKVILPFMLEECILNDEFNFLLTGTQRYAAYQKKAEALETLISRIRGILDVTSTSAEKTEPEANMEKEPETVLPPQKPAPIYLGEVVCPACGGDELTVLPRRIKRKGFAELSTMLLIPALAIVGYFTFLFLSAFIIPFDYFELVFMFIALGAIIGGFIGNIISKNIVKNRRIRRHLPNTCYRCKSCKKVFLGEKR